MRSSRALVVLATLAALLGAPSMVSGAEPLRTPDSAVIEASAPPTASSPATISMPSPTPVPSPAAATVAPPADAEEPATDVGPSLTQSGSDTSDPAAEPEPAAAPREATDPVPAAWTAPAPAPSPMLLAHEEEESQAPRESPGTGTAPPPGPASPTSSPGAAAGSAEAVPAREPHEETTGSAAAQEAVPAALLVSLAGVAALALVGTALLLGVRRRAPAPDDPLIAAEVERVMRTRALRRARLRRSGDSTETGPGSGPPHDETGGDPARET